MKVKTYNLSKHVAVFAPLFLALVEAIRALSPEQHAESFGNVDDTNKVNRTVTGNKLAGQLIGNRAGIESYGVKVDDVGTIFPRTEPLATVKAATLAGKLSRWFALHDVTSTAPTLDDVTAFLTRTSRAKATVKVVTLKLAGLTGSAPLPETVPNHKGARR